ncbi:Hypothetical predicted protein [Mytilus galloprovincialis]|uniref:DZIP3-like HEPN domain-containing protein n=1 Tax=Mytilus galloprovincialis TaxID=29158 RepID=A0A8B6DDQ2_MYTGA|nr:Hypothetical predicted protein [Mytilus galloprovincialis]
MATSLAQEDINFLRLAGLLIKIAPRAVRQRFDYEFHPQQLQQFLSKNRRKIDDLYKKRIFTLAQYDVLYTRGSSGVSSDKFDVSLMVCLLRNFTDIDIQDSLPLETIHTSAADISRIKFYRNVIVHSDSGKVTENKFSEIWGCVAEAIRRLSLDLKSEIDALMSATFTNASDIIDLLRLEKQMEKNSQHLNTVSQKLSTVSQKLETLEVENKNKREIYNRTLTEWRNKDKKYISTSATAYIIKSLNQKRGVIISGSPGCGKSVAAHHVALSFEKDGYEIILCDDPSEIITHFTTEKIQVFVIDDICGKFALNQHKADSWEQNNGKLSMLIESCTQLGDNEDSSNTSKTKFIITCRENIYSHKAFPKLACFSLVQCSFSTKYKITPDEMRNIALSYIPENKVNNIGNMCLYDFFPLLCSLYCRKTKPDPNFFSHPIEIIKQEIIEMKIKSEMSFLCLSLLVLKNNICCKNYLRSLDVEHLVKGICRDAEIESIVSMVSIQTCFERLKGIYIIETENIYTAIHDKMFDIISAAIAPFMMKCLIKHGDIRFLANRMQLMSVGRGSLPFVVYIPPELEIIHFNRQYQEAMKGYYWEVFGSIQTENEAYRKLLLSFLKEKDRCQQTSYVPDKDGTTPLFVSSSLGYIDFVQYFIVKCRHHIDIKDKEGRSPFFVACENGHIAIVKHLKEYHKDVNTTNASDTTILSATCLNGHIDVAQLLLDSKADIGITNELNQNSFHFACLNGNVQLVSLLFSSYNADITLRNTDEQTDLHKAYQNGLSKTNSKFTKLCRDINHKNNIESTPLHLACQKGHYETVKLLLGLNGQTINSCVDTHTINKHGFSILHAACYNGHTKIVKLLIDVGMNVNHTTVVGATPLSLACWKGHYDTVKYLLDLREHTLQGPIDRTTNPKDGWPTLHVACLNGHIEVVTVLIDSGFNINDTTADGYTPLYLACQNGHYDTVKLLLGLSSLTLTYVDSTIKDKKGLSVLHAACLKGHTQIVKLLIDIGMNVNEASNDGQTPLYVACRRGHHDIVKYLLDLNGKTLNSRVDITTRDEHGWSILHAVCSNGHKEVVKILIDIGLNVNDTTNDGYTPLYVACDKGHYDTVKLLLDLNGQTFNSRVDTTIKDEDGWSVLHLACSIGHTEVVKLLVDVGLNVNETTNVGDTPLYLACTEGHYDTVEYLLDLNDQTLNSRVDTTTRDDKRWSVLHTACYYGRHKIVMLLIDDGMNVNDTTHNGYTPLFLASCYYGRHKIVKLLIDDGMNVNETTTKGYTPLFLACYKGYYDIVKYLLDLNGQTLNSRVSALHAAYSNGHTKVVKLLTDFGINDRKTRNRKYSCVIL